MYHYLRCFVIVLFLLPVTSHGAETPIETDRSCELKLGWGSWPPYQYGNDPSSPKGIQIDLIKQIAVEANCKVTFVKNSFAGNLEAVKTGEVDFIMDTSVTEARKEFGYFSEPYRLEVLALYMKPELQHFCEQGDFAALIKKGIRIGMNPGNIYGPEVSRVQTENSTNQKLVYADSNDALYQLFFENKIDGFFEDPTVLAYNLRIKNQTGKLTLCKISQNASTVSFLFSKKSTKPEIVERFNRALNSVKKTRAYKASWGW